MGQVELDGQVARHSSQERFAMLRIVELDFARPAAQVGGEHLTQLTAPGNEPLAMHVKAKTGGPFGLVGIEHAR